MVYCLSMNLIIKFVSNVQNFKVLAVLGTSYQGMPSPNTTLSILIMVKHRCHVACLLITDLTVVLHVGEVAVSLALAAEAVHVGRREDGVRARGEANLVIRYLQSLYLESFVSEVSFQL